MENQENKSEKIYFFGWTNIKWLIRELRNLVSGKDSEFSLKRVERVAFIVLALGAYVMYFKTHIATMDGYTFVFVVTPLFGYAGYNLKKAQDEKTHIRNIDAAKTPEAPKEPEAQQPVQ